MMNNDELVEVLGQVVSVTPMSEWARSCVKSCGFKARFLKTNFTPPGDISYLLCNTEVEDDADYNDGKKFKWGYRVKPEEVILVKL